VAEMSDDDRFEAAAAPFSESELREIAPFGHERTVATGDVRHGSIKRVAAAVGEGSSAVRSVHEHLASAG